MKIHLVVIDNYDSFTYNLVQLLGIMCEKLAKEAKVAIFRNDQITIDGIVKLKPTHILISPGPCTPKEAGISVDVVKHFAGKVPILGVCLGHQSIGYAFGAEIVQARRLMHGKTSQIHHDRQGIFHGLPDPFEAMRYHSLVIEEKSLPDELIVTARDEEGEIMGIRHANFPIEGVQFHPESIGTSLNAWERLKCPPKDWDFTSENLPEGVLILRNFLFHKD